VKAGKKARVRAIHESQADAERKHLLINEGARSGKDLSVVIKHRQEDRVAIGIFIHLPDVVESGVRLLGIPWAELIE
jgi:hypothetical protein